MAFTLSSTSLSLLNVANEHGISIQDNVRAMILNSPMSSVKLSVGKTTIKPNFKTETKAGKTVGEVFGKTLDSRSVLDTVAKQIQKGGFTATVKLDDEGKRFTIKGSPQAGDWATAVFVQELHEGENLDSAQWAEKLILASNDARRLKDEANEEKRLMEEELASLEKATAPSEVVNV